MKKATFERLTWAAGIAAVLGFAGCSAAGTSNSQGLGNEPASSGSDQGSSSTSGSSGSQSSTGSGSGSGSPGAVSSGVSSSGTSSTGASGASSGSSTSGTSTTASDSDAGSGSTAGDNSDSGVVMPSHGCGQGTSCTPGTDLAPPATADGFQLVLNAGQVTIDPNKEAYYCLYKTIPGNAAIQVGAFQSWMSSESSHHFITYQSTGAKVTDGTLEQCSAVAGNWVYATSVAGQVIELKMPDSVGLNMATGTQLILNMHFINPGTTPLSPTLKLNVLYAKNVQYQAGTMVAFNIGIDVPPANAQGPGTQTVRGTCTASVGSKFFAVTTHTHKHATETDVNFVSGGQSQNILKTTDWESPDVGLWYAPNFLEIQQGDSFTYSCSYSNTSSTAVTVGETAASNEMCMAIGYYFPQATATCD